MMNSAEPHPSHPKSPAGGGGRRIHRIAVITGDHTLPDPTKHGGRWNAEDAAAHEAMVAAFRSFEGYEFEFMTRHEDLLERLRRDPPDLAVNFCDTGFRNVPTRELNLPAYLELLGIPYTGAPPAAMVTCYDKAVVRLVADSLNVPVPREIFVPADVNADDVPDLLPALIKPNMADGSVGITKDAVVRTRKEMLDYLNWLRDTLPGRDALIQEYLPGAEYGIGLIGNPENGLTMFPPLQVDYSRLPAGLNPILSFESKAVPDSPYWTDIKFRRAVITGKTEQCFRTWTEQLFRRFGLRDYARFDFRQSTDGVPRLMEVNPNPAWSNDGKLAFMASFAGLGYPDMLRMIVEAAIRRLGSTGA